jgi:hypothetical protein
MKVRGNRSSVVIGTKVSQHRTRTPRWKLDKVSSQVAAS